MWTKVMYNNQHLKNEKKTFIHLLLLYKEAVSSRYQMTALFTFPSCNNSVMTSMKTPPFVLAQFPNRITHDGAFEFDPSINRHYAFLYTGALH